MEPAGSISLLALAGVPLVQRGDDLVDLLAAALRTSGQALRHGDVLVVAQKIVSKSEGRRVRLADVVPSPRAIELASLTGKDARLVELVLSESSEVVRHARDVLIVEHRLGFVMANAGVDQSNIEDGDQWALLLPVDPDESCRRLRACIQERWDVDVAVVINDSHGRAFRNGVVGVSIGAAGLPALLDLRGEPDLFGRQLRITQVGHADEIAAAASLVMGQAGDGVPMVLCRGLRPPSRDGSARELVRRKQMDLFR
ncbi:MAG TPA: coenzyme F420-0:L-glutamate ligase [Ramlibacter sp.]|nr:coenzyme F420-0:L-glutamate ligase [Ramlibacter sp.]